MLAVSVSFRFATWNAVFVVVCAPAVRGTANIAKTTKSADIFFI
jgi:hypothetical protein